MGPVRHEPLALQKIPYRKVVPLLLGLHSPVGTILFWYIVHPTVFLFPTVSLSLPLCEKRTGTGKALY